MTISLADSITATTLAFQATYVLVPEVPLPEAFPFMRRVFLASRSKLSKDVILPSLADNLILLVELLCLAWLTDHKRLIHEQ